MSDSDFCDNNGNCMGIYENKMYTECKHFKEWDACSDVCIHFLFSDDIGEMTCNRSGRLEGER